MNKIKSVLNYIRRKKIEPIFIPVDRDNILKDKLALIIGGSGGIGLAIAKRFLESGAKVVITGRNEDKLQQCIRSINNENVKGLVMDITDVKGIPDKLAEAGALFAGEKISILVNSGGVHNKCSFENMDEVEYDTIMNTNVKGVYFCCQAMCKYLKENKIWGGHILNISSSSALRPATTPYHLSKWALAGLTKGLARQYYHDGIIINAIAPGQTATPMLGIKDNSDVSNGYAFAGRYIMPQEVASLALLMVSNSGNMIVGDTVYISGGSGVVTFEG